MLLPQDKSGCFGKGCLSSLVSSLSVFDTSLLLLNGSSWLTEGVPPLAVWSIAVSSQSKLELVISVAPNTC